MNESHHHPEVPEHGGHGMGPAHESHADHEPDAGHDTHAGHDRHAGHSVSMFRDKFWLSLALTIPTLVWGHMLQRALGYTAPAFPGAQWIPAAFGTAVFLYGGWVFVNGAARELRNRLPGMEQVSTPRSPGSCGSSRPLRDPGRAPRRSQRAIGQLLLIHPRTFEMSSPILSLRDRRVVRVVRQIVAAAVITSLHAPRPASAQQDTTVHPMPAMAGMAGMAGMQMIDGPLGIPMERTGSGTSWLPDDSPMHAYHVMAGPWELMLHGVAFAMYDKQGSRRGDEQFSSVNWGMLMATREARGGRLQFRGMVSAEPWTVGGQGYRLLLQTGESWRGVPLHDRQHPHDLFMELAGLYEHSISNRLGVSLYLAPVGEPAIGPVAFPHRPSAMNDPMAPIAHHWQDATHISFGVVTAGVFTHTLRLEGSIFNGREPDENRTNFDYTGHSLDSYAGRLSWNPSAHWALSGSYAYLASPESLKPDEPVHRVNASIMNGRTFGRHGELATTLIYGANRHSGAAHLEPSWLLESNLEVGGAHSIFGRAEYVQKGAEDLVLGSSRPTGEFNIVSLVGGYVYEFDRNGSIRTGIGIRASIDIIPAALEPWYESRTPGGFAVYVRFRAQRMSEGHDKRTSSQLHPIH